MATARPSRQQVRHPVRLEVRFKSADEFVREYAENLSLGGLFIVGAHHLQPFEKITIELDLPRFNCFQVTGRVAHILDPETAAQHGRRPGAGVELIRTPPFFEEALTRYLSWLGMRREHWVIATNPSDCDLLEQAGYQTSLATSPSDLGEFIATPGRSVLAILAHPDDVESFSEFGDLVVPVGDRKRGVITLTDSLLIEVSKP